jgi:hypothetical protein
MNTDISRRRALALGAGLVGGTIAVSSPLLAGAPPVRASTYPGGSFSQSTIHQMEQIFQTSGTQDNGVLSFELDRKDLSHYTVGSKTLSSHVPVPFSPDWENNGSFYFQPLNGNGSSAIMNADFGGLLPQEVDPFIDQLLAHDITFQAFHQHFDDVLPAQLFFIHFRAVGDPIQLARGVMAAVKTTGIPFPQFSSSTPTTPLDVHQLVSILGGSAQVGSGGVVTVNVPRTDKITLGGVPINPYLNVAAPVAFLPLDSKGTTVAAAPDFNMIAAEVQKVMKVMRSQGWVVGCLYNQETDEFPQLYFSHQLKVGDPITLAKEIRKGFDQMQVVAPGQSS